MVKRLAKRVVAKFPFLKYFLMGIYKMNGRKPWSLGYPVYKFFYIRETIEANLKTFEDSQLPRHYGLGLDERVVEYPWLFSRLKDDFKTILDAGATLNHTDILSLKQLKDKKIYVMTLAHEEFAHTRIQSFFIIGDLRYICYRNEFFDAVVCISTIEHIGMDNTFLYTADPSKKENGKFAFLDAVSEFKRILKKGGILYATVPYGEHKNYSWFQIFDAAMIERLIDVFSPVQTRATYFKYENNQWNLSDKDGCRQGIYFDVHSDRRRERGLPVAAECVVCLELTK